MFNWAFGRGLVDGNPFAGLRLGFKSKARNRTLSLSEAGQVYVAAGQMGYPFGPLFQLLLLTGCRLREMAHARWSWVEGNFINIPGQHRKNGQSLAVPISSAAAELLRQLPRWEGDFIIFSTMQGRRPVSGFSKAKQLTEGDLLPFVVHDFRRPCEATWRGWPWIR